MVQFENLEMNSFEDMKFDGFEEYNQKQTIDHEKRQGKCHCQAKF